MEQINEAAETLPLTQEQRQAICTGLIKAAEAAVRNGEPVNLEGLNMRDHGSETVGYIRLLSRRGIAALYNSMHTL